MEPGIYCESDMGFAEGRTWTSWLGTLTAGPAARMTCKHNRVGIFWKERRTEEKKIREIEAGMG